MLRPEKLIMLVPIRLFALNSTVFPRLGLFILVDRIRELPLQVQAFGEQVYILAFISQLLQRSLVVLNVHSCVRNAFAASLRLNFSETDKIWLCCRPVHTFFGG